MYHESADIKFSRRSYGTFWQIFVTPALMRYSTGVIRSEQKVSPAVDPDRELVQRIAAQDQDALQILYARHAPGLLRYLTARIGEARLAEEALQDVMLAAWRGASRFRGECRVYTWLLSIARRCAINAYHRQVVPASRDLPFGDEAIPAAWLDAPGRYHDLAAALQALPAEQSEVIELVFYHGLSLAETARVLQVAPGTVKSRLHRARIRLRAWMNAEK